MIKGFGGKPEKKSLIGRPRRRLEDDFKVDVQEMGWGLGLMWLGRGSDGGLL